MTRFLLGIFTLLSIHTEISCQDQLPDLNQCALFDEKQFANLKMTQRAWYLFNQKIQSNKTLTASETTAFYENLNKVASVYTNKTDVCTHIYTGMLLRKYQELHDNISRHSVTDHDTIGQSNALEFLGECVSLKKEWESRFELLQRFIYFLEKSIKQNKLTGKMTLTGYYIRENIKSIECKLAELDYIEIKMTDLCSILYVHGLRYRYQRALETLKALAQNRSI